MGRAWDGKRAAWKYSSSVELALPGGMTFSHALVGLLALAFLQACSSFVHVPAVLWPERPSCELRGAPLKRGERGKAVQQSMATQECDVFDWLAKGAGVDKVVSLGMVEDEYRGLMTDCDVEEGQVRHL